jgi:peptidoglycan hydrolase-like protein with peptidoglycan-binding domain
VSAESNLSQSAGLEDEEHNSGAFRWVIPAALALVGILIAGAVVHNRSTNSDVSTIQAATATATVKRTDLVETTSYDGVLTYGDSRSIRSQAMGTVTWLPKAGSTVKQGERLYDVNETSAYLMYGSIPMYRTLQSGVSSGRDVEQLESDLHSMGFDSDGMTIDTTFTSATTAAIEAWQAHLGVTQNGVVTPALITFLPSSLRVQSLSAQVGDSASVGTSLYSASGTDRIATVTLSAADSTVAKSGERVDVTLPNGHSVPGVIESVATATSSSSGGSGANSGSGGSVNQQGAGATAASSSVDVTVAVADPVAAQQPDQTPVSVAFTSSGAKNVLAVPVTALIALSGGGYAVEVQQSTGSTQLLAVTPGLYAVGGMVQVSGSGLSEGMTVVIPAGA